MSDNPIKETWWTVQTTTGLTLQLPAPLRSIAVNDSWRTLPEDPEVYLERGGAVYSQSKITGKSYALRMADVLFIETYEFEMDPARYQRAILNLRKRLSGTFSTSGPEADWSSDDPESPGGPSTGGRTKRPTRH